VGANNGPTVGRLSSAQEEQSSDPIQEQAGRDNAHGAEGREILHSDQQAVSEIQIGFLGGKGAQCPAPNMVYDGWGRRVDVVARTGHTPTKIDFFHVGK